MVYAGLHKVSCDMCGGVDGYDYIVTHEDGSCADICAVCYGKCQTYPKFQDGIKSGEIKVAPRGK